MSAVNLSVGLDKVRAKLVAGLGVLQDVPFHPHIVRTKKKRAALDKDERRHLNSSSKQENNGSRNERIASFIR